MSERDWLISGFDRGLKALIPNPIKRVQCESPSKTSFIKRADPELLKGVFLKYASVEKDGEFYMTDNDFIRRFIGLMQYENYNRNTVKLLANVADTTKDGLISFVEFQAFEALLCAPDSVYVMAFQIFDTNSSGFLSYDEFEDVLKRTDLYQHIPFNFNSSFILLHFGKNKERTVSYTEFTQLLHDFYEEHALQAFTRYDKDRSGFITALEFLDIMTHLKGHLMTNFVKTNLISIAGGGHGMKKVSYAYFIAFISLLNSMELVKQIYSSASKGNHAKELTKEELLHEAQKYSQITPMEIDILFQLNDARRQDGRITYLDIQCLAPLDLNKMPYSIQAQALQEKIQDQYAGHGRGVLIQVFESVYRFGLGSVAGAIGATTVYPIDLVKTRLQNQRIGSQVGDVMYKNSMDCFQKVIRHEGFKGLYRGLAPQLVGVAPEKAIKLTMNDLLRDKLTGKDGKIPLWAEFVAGGCAGASQVMFTNPLEIVKIRLQVAGEIASNRRIGAGAVIKELGFFGLYKGSRACFARDIPFSAIYFPAYSHMKKMTANEDGYNSLGSLLFSATTAGAPAAPW